jgi:hypothetical protein
VHLSAVIARESRLKAHQRARISIGEFKPIATTSLMLEQRLVLFNPVEHGNEAMIASQTLGAENW